MYKDIISDDTGSCQLTCIPVYCVYQNTHTLLPLVSSSQSTRSIPLGVAAQEGHLDTVKRLRRPAHSSAGYEWRTQARHNGARRQGGDDGEVGGGSTRAASSVALKLSNNLDALQSSVEGG